MQHLQRLVVLTLTLATTCLVGEEKKDEKPEAGFVPLFDGKSLAGWEAMNCPKETFFVKEKMLITTGIPTGLLRTSKMYENFILELEWMHMKAKGNSGVFVWADGLPGVGSPFTRAIEVQVLDGTETKDYTSDGDLFSTEGAKFTPDRPHPSGWARCLPSEKRSKPAGQWNHYRVVCDKGRITLAVNGKVVSGGSKCTPRTGYICLEAEGSECRFRNLKIKELPSTKPTAAETAREAKGHLPLFSGMNLDGWKGSAEVKKLWSPQAGPNLLRRVGKELDTIRSVQEYKDCELIVDVKIPDTKAQAEFILRGEEKSTINLATAPVKKWHRHVITIKGDRVTVVIDGKTAIDDKEYKVPAKGPIAFTATGGVEFANILLRELK